MQQPEAAPAGPPAPPQGPARPPTPGRGSPDPQDPQDSPEALREPEEEQADGRPEDPEEDFSFLHCAACGSEPKAPKLLGCLHTLCGGCLGEPGAGCPACGEPGDTGVLDNAFFENLQRRLATHRQVVGARAPCSRCREQAAVWCPECEQLLCSCCNEAHGWFLKHEARPLAELRAQPASDFLDSTRRGCAIFCANSTHRVPTLTSIYCRGCDKPLCCACALLDRGHAEQQCDLGAEVRERQEELGAAVRALREQEATFREARGRAREAEGRLLSARAEAETVIRARVHMVLEHVRARERALLAAVAARFEREHATLGARLRGLDAGLQRLRAGGALVARMERFASDQEVLDMHSFLRGALGRLRGQRPAGPAGLRPNCFAEFLVPLQDLVSDIRQATALPVTTSPEPACTPRTPSEADLPEDLQGEEACTLGLAAVRPEPDAHPVPTFAFSIRAAPHSKEDAPAALPPKRKACQTESPHKLIKLELGGPCPQPRPSTSQAVLDRLPSPGNPKSPESLQSLDLGRETVNSSPAHEDLSEPGETEDRVVVLSSSEDSAPEGPPHPETDSGSEDSDMQLEGPCPLWGLDDSVCPPRTKDGALVFFDLKIDPESQTLTQLAAVSQDTQFRARLCPPQSVSLQAGLHGFLAFLRAWRHPVLACRRLWGRRLPALFAALEEAELLEDFLEAVSGLLAVLPLLRERVPAAPRPHLRGLARTYLAREMGAGSALAGAMALRDLCRLLDVGPGARLQPYVHAPRSLHCFAGLQPLVRAAVLGRGDARLLALHQVGLAELRDAHRRDPRAGLLHYGRFLAAPGQPAPGLQALAAYFQAQPAPPPRCTPGPRTCPQS